MTIPQLVAMVTLYNSTAECIDILVTPASMSNQTDSHRNYSSQNHNRQVRDGIMQEAETAFKSLNLQGITARPYSIKFQRPYLRPEATNP